MPEAMQKMKPVVQDMAYYKELYNEARQLQGVSLFQDAQRRLKKNKVAMASLYLLILIGSLALLTPLLPLQSPKLQEIRRRSFEAPNWRAQRLESEDHTGQRRSLTELMQLYRAELAELRRSGTPEQIAGREAMHPFKLFWYNPGAVTWQMLHLRVALFGDWCLPSLCGTDKLGRDILSRLFWGARVSLLVGIVAASVSLVIGVTYGATSGFLGGWVDALMMRIVDMLYSIPFLFVAIFIISILSEESIKARLEAYGISRIMIFYVVIGALFWLTMARVVRGQVLSLKHEPFIDAARTLGASTPRIIAHHLIPNVTGVVIVYLTLTIPAVMLFEAVLSYLGLGVQPPDVSWGMLADDGMKVITPLKTYWWMVVFPSVAISSTLFALNFLGDGLRDAFDPRLKNR